MADPLSIVEGWTGALPFTCEADGTAVNLTGLTVTAVLHDKARAHVTTTSKLTVTDAAAGKVEYAPAAADFVAAKSPYWLRIKVVDGASKVVYFPSEESFKIVVRQE